MALNRAHVHPICLINITHIRLRESAKLLLIFVNEAKKISIIKQRNQLFDWRLEDPAERKARANHKKVIVE